MSLTTDAEIRASIPNGSTLDSAVVSALNAAASAAAKTYLGRNIESASFVNRVKAEIMGDRMFLAEYPIQSVESIAVSGNDALDVWNAGATRATVSVTDTGLTLREFVSGAWITTPLTYAANETLGDMKTAIEAVSGNRWDAELSTGMTGAEPSEELADLNVGIDVSNSKHKTLLLMDNQVQTEVDYELGSFRFVDCGVSRGEIVLCRYTAGYSTIPADISKGVALLAAEIYKLDQSSANGNMKREKLGAYEYETHQNQAALFSPTVVKLLGPHRRVHA